MLLRETEPGEPSGYAAKRSYGLEPGYDSREMLSEMNMLR
jgi:hypothetical protein